MKNDRNLEPSGSPSAALITTAIGAAAVAGFVIGALAISRLLARRITIDRARFNSLEIEDLAVRRLYVSEILDPDDY